MPAVHKKSVRNDLEPRREPYWGAPLSKGRYIGVRKRRDGSCTWIARLHDDDGKHRYRALGQVTKDFEYDQAVTAARDWFRDFDADVTDGPPTVAEACREYVADLEAEGRPDAAHDADMRFKRTIYSDPIAKVQAEKLKTARVKAWRNGLGGAKASQNRNLNALRAALNLAVEHHRVNPACAQQWRAVKSHKGAGNRRTLFLDLKQRRRLLAKCEGAVRDLVEAAMLTGARPGELVNMKRSQFEARTATATFKGKTGSRQVPLSEGATDLFTRLAKGKLPGAYLLTDDDGQPWPHSGWDKLVKAAAKAAKLPAGVVLYTMRHSYITEALRSGLPTLDVARLTGTSLQMLQNHYGHLVTEAARERLSGVEML